MRPRRMARKAYMQASNIFSFWTTRVCTLQYSGNTDENFSCSKHVGIKTERYSKLTGSIPKSMTTSMPIATIIIDIWVHLNGIPSYFLTYIGLELVSKRFMHLWTFLRLRSLTIIASHRRTGWQMEWYKRTLVARVCHYVSKHHKIGKLGTATHLCIQHIDASTDGKSSFQWNIAAWITIFSSIWRASWACKQYAEERGTTT